MIRNLLSILLMLCLIQCTSREKDEVLSEAAPERPVEREGWNSTLSVTQMGKPQAYVQYGHMRQYAKDPLVYLDEGVMVDFFDETGKIKSHLTSDKGTYHEKTRDVSARENVVVVSDTGVTLYTEYLEWDNRIDKIVSDTHVTFVQEGDTMYGKGFVSDSDLKNWEIEKPFGSMQEGVNIQSLHEEFEKPKQQDSVHVITDTTQADSLVQDIPEPD